ncbi:MAG: nucleoside hydrolase [Planctomycetota bacterium]
MPPTVKSVAPTQLMIAFCGVSLALFFSTGFATAQESKPRLILDADTANEIDDMYAIVRMLNQDQYEVLALSSAQWIHYLGEPDSVGASQTINEELLRLLNRTSLPTPKGSDEPMGKPWGGFDPKDSPAAQSIIRAARAASAERKLIVMCLGASTNLASAIAIEPSIAKNIEARILGFQYDWSTGIWNKSEFNIRRDLNAADYLLNCNDLELHIMPTSVARQLTFSRDATFENHRRLGALGAYLTEKWKARFAGSKMWVMWDLALVQALLKPEQATSEEVTTPPENVGRKVWMYRTIDAPAMKADYWDVVLTSDQAGG